MDQTALVVEQIKAGRELLDALESRFPIATAVWVLREGALEWRFYIATQEASRDASSDLEAVLFEVMAGHPSLWIARHQVCLIGSNHPVAQDALRRRRQDSEAAMVRFDGGIFGSASVQQAFIYGGSLTPQKVA